METPLNASATTAGALMSTSTFVIPPYQREYAWTVDEVDEFWSDLCSGLEDESYFLGLIILTDQDGAKQVVDGQQRILTMTLLAAALRHEAVRAGRNALADRISADFLQAIDYATDETQPRVVLSDDLDNATFQQILNSPDSLDPNTIYNEESLSPKLLSAHRKLSGNLHEHLAPDPFKKLGIWADYLTNHVYLAVFVHPDPASAYRVFEVINTRGRELTTADLLKNYVLSQTSPRQSSDRYKEWQRISRQLIPAGASALVQFIRHVVSLDAGYVLPRDLYDYIAERSSTAGKERRTPPTADELMAKLEDWAPLYLQLIDPTLDGPADPEWLQVFASLEDLGVISVRPIIMALTLTEQSSEGMRDLLRLVVRRIVVGNLGTGNVERRFSETARKINLSRTWRSELQELSDLNPTAEEFIEQLRKRSLNKGTLTFLRRSIIQSTITPEPLGTLHLIRPRQAPDWDGFPDDEFTYWGSTIGNTLLAGTERRPKGTSAWAGFKSILLPEAVEGERTNFLSPLNDWTAESVESEGKQLGSEASSVWYDPDVR